MTTKNNAQRLAEWKLRNPDKVKAAEDRRRQAVRNDPERLAKSREYRRDYQRRKRAAFSEEEKEIEREKSRIAEMKKKFGIGTEEYERILAAQDYVCAICGSPSPRSSRKERFAIDHDHDTGKIRGVLCNPCNRGIGLLGDKVSRLQAAVDYLKATVLV